MSSNNTLAFHSLTLAVCKTESWSSPCPPIVPSHRSVASALGGLQQVEEGSGPRRLLASPTLIRHQLYGLVESFLASVRTGFTTQRYHTDARAPCAHLTRLTLLKFVAVAVLPVQPPQPDTCSELGFSRFMYGMSKVFQIAYTRVLACSLASQGCTSCQVNAVCPG